MSDSGAPGPTDWYLIASLYYTAAEVGKIVHESKPAETAVLDGKEIRPWFSESLKENWASSGKGFRSVVPAYKGTPFYRGTLHDGYFVVVGGANEIFVYLQCCTAVIGK